jgi:hypothetical protein
MLARFCSRYLVSAVFSMNNLVFLVASWNVRGLGDDDKCDTVSADLSVARPNLVALQESKLGPIAPTKVAHFFPASLRSFVSVDTAGALGGLVTVWDQNIFNLSNSFLSRNILTIDLSFHADGSALCYTNIYAPCDRSDKIVFL